MHLYVLFPRCSSYREKKKTRKNFERQHRKGVFIDQIDKRCKMKSLPATQMTKKFKRQHKKGVFIEQIDKRSKMKSLPATHITISITSLTKTTTAEGTTK